MADEKIDFIAFGAHPDDVEITVGGTLYKLKKMGYRTGIVDMTRGEAGTYGTPEERSKESRHAAEILQADVRINLGFPDGNLRNSQETRAKVIEVIRKYRPEIVCAPVTRTRHPDHENAGIIVREASFLAGLEKVKTEYENFRPSAVIYFLELLKGTPDFVVDITDEWEVKIAAIKAHRSQVYDETVETDHAVKTFIKSKDFWGLIQARFRSYGGMAGVTYAEAFCCDYVVKLDDVVRSLTRKIK